MMGGEWSNSHLNTDLRPAKGCFATIKVFPTYGPPPHSYKLSYAADYVHSKQ